MELKTPGLLPAWLEGWIKQGCMRSIERQAHFDLLVLAPSVLGGLICCLLDLEQLFPSWTQNEGASVDPLK